MQPLAVAGSELTAVSIIDTKQESRTRLLEQAFLHDIVNAAGSIQMLIDLLTESTSRQERSEYVKLLQVSMNRLLSEVYHEKMMLENPGPVPSVCNIREVFESLAQYYRNHPLGRNCRIDVDTSAVQTVNVLSDQTLLVRVLDNMLRNAIEATGDGGVVTMGCRQVNGALECWVHNPNAISEHIRAKIFNQPFSTKGRDRGVGTQEIKVLSELCGGTVAVSSDPEQGTTFSVRYPAAPERVSPHKRYHTRHAS
jgi:signal transduction histidine kinase